MFVGKIESPLKKYVWEGISGKKILLRRVFSGTNTSSETETINSRACDSNCQMFGKKTFC